VTFSAAFSSSPGLHAEPPADVFGDLFFEAEAASRAGAVLPVDEEKRFRAGVLRVAKKIR
jgi:hypothetical protein